MPGILAGLFAVQLLTGCLHCGNRNAEGTERAMFATYPLFTKKMVGTCFLVAMKAGNAGRTYFPVVVTSKHLLAAAGDDAMFLPLRVLGADGTFAVVPVRVDRPGNRSGKFVGHPELDVAAFPMALPRELQARCALILFEEGNIVGQVPSVGTEVSFVGFPEGMSGTPDLLPVLRAGRVASFDPGASAPRLFLVNGDVFPGDSGAPILLAQSGSRPRLAGMVVQRVEMSSGERSPLAVAVDARGVLETLRLVAVPPAP